MFRVFPFLYSLSPLRKVSLISEKAPVSPHEFHPAGRKKFLRFHGISFRPKKKSQQFHGAGSQKKKSQQFHGSGFQKKNSFSFTGSAFPPEKKSCSFTGPAPRKKIPAVSRSRAPEKKSCSFTRNPIVSQSSSQKRHQKHWKQAFSRCRPPEKNSCSFTVPVPRKKFLQFHVAGFQKKNSCSFTGSASPQEKNSYSFTDLGFPRKKFCNSFTGPAPRKKILQFHGPRISKKKILQQFHETVKLLLS